MIGAGSTTRKTQMGDQAVMQPVPDSRQSESPAITFERVLNTEEAAALLQIHPKTLQRMARQGSQHSVSEISGGFALRLQTSGSVLAYAQSATRAVNTKGRFSCLRARDISMGVWKPKYERKG